MKLRMGWPIMLLCGFFKTTLFVKLKQNKGLLVEDGLQLNSSNLIINK